MLIERANIQKDCLKGKTVLITGAGGGIGFEAAKALAWMGAKVVIAEIDKVKGQKGEKAINEQLNKSAALFYHIDISDELQIDKLHSFIIDQYGFVDIVFNNATIAPQYNGWLQRNVFERQWVFRDFKKEVKLSSVQFMQEINNMQALLEQGDCVSLGQKKSLFISLQGYYRHQHKLMLS